VQCSRTHMAHRTHTAHRKMARWCTTRLLPRDLRCGEMHPDIGNVPLWRGNATRGLRHFLGDRDALFHDAMLRV